MLTCNAQVPTLVRVVELVQNAWGDWWIVRDGIPLTVHVHNESSADAYAAALEHAQTLFPEETPSTQAFRRARWAPCD